MNSKGDFNNISHHITPSEVVITSMVSDPKKDVLFIAFASTIYMVKNFSVRQNDSLTFSLVYTGKSFTIDQIAVDYLSANIYWCDFHLNWIAMKPAYKSVVTIQKVVVQDELNGPSGLALDPEDG